jgi:hypothetical protein
MARKLVKSGFLTIAQLARKLGVSGQAVSQAIRSGRLVAYDGRGRVPPGYAGRKWLKPAEAAEDWHNRRRRFDDGTSDDLVAARGRVAMHQAALLSLHLDRERGDVIPKATADAAMKALGRAIQRANKGIVTWAEETCSRGAGRRYRRRF